MVELEVGVFASPPKSALPMASLQRRSAAQPASVVSTVASFKAQNSFACLWERGISAIPSSAPPFGMPHRSSRSSRHRSPLEAMPALKSVFPLIVSAAVGARTALLDQG
jgi:hypothetical protein